MGIKISDKSRLITFLLAFFLGGLGIHRFYVGKTGSGVAMLLLTLLSPFTLFISLIVVGIWTFMDWIVILVGRFEDKYGARVWEW
jgi:TM2 domain-containing membrane protein YozV